MEPNENNISKDKNYKDIYIDILSKNSKNILKILEKSNIIDKNLSKEEKQKIFVNKLN